jgi:predicted NBD/HSP70 family sugar kinase
MRLGSNQAGMRAHNEQLVLTLVRRYGQLSKTDIARMTGLSAQTVSVIMRRLEADRLLLRGEPQRGRVGQPSVPLSLNPEGAFFLGAKVGRRGLDVVMVDFTGVIRHRSGQRYAYPEPGTAISRIRDEVTVCQAMLGKQADRLAGLGIAMPFRLWNWADEIGAPRERMDQWRNTDIRAELAGVLDLPVYVENDATAACGAELAFGGSSDLMDFIYFFVGTIIGGGIVLSAGLYPGRTGNAGALGPLPVPGLNNGAAEQLMDQASLVVLERRLRAVGMPADCLQDMSGDWSAFEPHLSEWIALAAHGIAYAIASASAVIDFQAVVIDGAFPVPVQDRLLAGIAGKMQKLDLSGIDPPDLRSGTIGSIARALGGASLPLFDRYLMDQHALVRTDTGVAD